MWLKALLNKYNKMPVAAKASFWFLFCNVVQKAISMLTVPIITRMLNTSEYGIYSVFNSYSNILIVFGTLNVFGNGYFVGMKKYKEDKHRYTSSLAGLMLLLTSLIFILFFASRGVITAYTGMGTMVCILMFIWMYGQGAINLWFIENRYEFKYRLIVVGTLFTAIATPILKIFLIAFFQKKGIDKSIGAILGFVLPVVILGVVAWTIIFVKGKRLYVKEYWKFTLVFNIPLIPYYLSQTILNQADRIMIERLDSAGSAGVYSVAYSLAMAISIINSAVNNSFIPWQFQEMEKGGHKRVAKTVSIIMLVIAAFHLLLIFVAPEIMKIFAAKEYSEAIYVIPPVTIGVMVIWLTQIFINVEFFYEKNKLIAMSSVISALLNIMLNAVAIPKFGYLAAGYTTLICYLANMVFHGTIAVKLSRDMKAERAFQLNKMVLLTVGSIVFMFAIMFLYEYSLIRYGVLLVLGITVLIKYRKLKMLLTRLWGTVRER